MKRRSLGQHYLVDTGVVQRMVAAARVQPHENVLEIGTGKGILTERLAGLGSGLEAFEVDPVNYAETKSRVAGGKVLIHLADAFKASPKFDVLVSSLPYSKSVAFVEWLSQMDYDRAVVLLQKDFVDKLLSPPGSRDYRAISAIAQIASRVKRIDRVGREAFEPRPKVNSVIVSITPKRKLSKKEISFVKRLFSLRRKEVEAVLRTVGLESKRDFGHRRVFMLTPNEVMELWGDVAA